jgi:ABC-type multidrug transport system ATPase subunit
MGDIVLEITALTRHFGAFTAVDALTLSVNAGEVFGLHGSNGAGKTYYWRPIVSPTCGIAPT